MRAKRHSADGGYNIGVFFVRGLYPQQPQEILDFHQGRGNMENFIREGKINYDSTLPLPILKRHHVLWAFALVAHNFLGPWRFSSADKPHFAKKLRRQMSIFRSSVKGSGYFRMKIPHKFYKEVMAWD